MTNRDCMAAVVQSAELRHHGVMGMEWGERHGPPYPLGGLDKKVARAEAKRKKARERALEKARKAAKKKRKAEARQLKLESKQAKRLEKNMLLKEKLLADGDLDAIKKHHELFTTQELNDAIIRARVLEEVKTKKPGKKESQPQPPKERPNLNKILATMAAGAVSVATIAKAGSDVVKLVGDIKKTQNAKQINDLNVSSKELSILTQAFEAQKSGITPADSYFRAAKDISSIGMNSAKPKSGGESSTSKPAADSSQKSSGSQPKSVQSLIPRELIDAYRDPLVTNAKSDAPNDKFFKSLTKKTGITRDKWDTMLSASAKELPTSGVGFVVSDPKRFSSGTTAKSSNWTPRGSASQRSTFEYAASLLDQYRSVKLY